MRVMGNVQVRRLCFRCCRLLFLGAGCFTCGKGRKVGQGGGGESGPVFTGFVLDEQKERSTAVQFAEVQSGHWVARAAMSSSDRAMGCPFVCGMSCRNKDRAPLDKWSAAVYSLPGKCCRSKSS